MHTLPILFFLLLCFPLTASAKLLYSNSFDQGSTDYGTLDQCASSSISAGKCPSTFQSVPNTQSIGVSSIARSGTGSLLSIARPDWGTGGTLPCFLFGQGPFVGIKECDRSEPERAFDFTPEEERWYGFSVYIDPSTQYTLNEAAGGPAVLQLHQVDGCGSGPGPHLVIVFAKTSGLWRIFNYSSNHQPCATSGDIVTKNYNGHPWVTGVWTDFVIHARWSIGATGFLTIWQDGDMIVNDTGQNTKPNYKRDVLKFGVYQPWWIGHTPPAGEKMVVYHDNIKVGDENSSFAEVSPGTIPTLTAPTSLAVVVGP